MRAISFNGISFYFFLYCWVLLGVFGVIVFGDSITYVRDYILGFLWIFITAIPMGFFFYKIMQEKIDIISIGPDAYLHSLLAILLMIAVIALGLTAFGYFIGF